jgi:hypothetical protein
MTLGPIVTSSGLTEDKVIRSKELTEWTGTDRVHGTWLKIHQYGSWNITTTGGFVEIDIDSLQLKIGITVIGTGRIDTVLVGNNLPKFGTDLVTSLTTCAEKSMKTIYYQRRNEPRIKLIAFRYHF